MIGYVYVSDIPKLIICIAIGIALMLIWGSALEYFFPHGGTVAASLALVGFIGTLGFSWWAGTAIWERIDDWLYWRKSQRLTKKRSASTIKSK
jgi:hypothetical protein